MPSTNSDDRFKIASVAELFDTRAGSPACIKAHSAYTKIEVFNKRYVYPPAYINASGYLRTHRQVFEFIDVDEWDQTGRNSSLTMWRQQHPTTGDPQIVFAKRKNGVELGKPRMLVLTSKSRCQVQTVQRPKPLVVPADVEWYWNTVKPRHIYPCSATGVTLTDSVYDRVLVFTVGKMIYVNLVHPDNEGKTTEERQAERAERRAKFGDWIQGRRKDAAIERAANAGSAGPVEDKGNPDGGE